MLVNLLRAFWNECRNFFDMLYRLRAVLIFAPLFVIGFANDQAIDIAREYQSADRHFADRFDLLLVTLLVTAIAPLLTIPFILEQQGEDESRFGFGRRLAMGIIVFLAILPAVYFSAVLHSGPTGLVTSEFSTWNTSLTAILYLTIISSVLFALLPSIIFAKLAHVWKALRLRWLSIGLLILVLVAYVSLCILPLLVSNESLFPLIRGMAGRLGMFPFIGLFLLALFALAALSSVLFDTRRIPLLSIVVVAAAGFAATGVNSDLDARLLGEAEMQPRPISSAFRDWIAKRKDYTEFRAANPSRPYPVYLVAMAGGGAYAGFHGSYFLARLFESCPRLRHHTFAISGVSGGSLGAALIAAEAGRKPGGTETADAATALQCNIDPGLESAGADSRKIEEFFSLDHVSFLIWARLYPDMLRRLLWFKAPRMASDTLFEKWFDTAWSSISNDPKALSLSDSVYSYWRPDGDAPALFFNVTNTQTGRAEAISPLLFPRNLPSRKNVDMRLITAASLSFRFPILNSPGSLPRNTSIPAPGFDPITAYDTLETTSTYVDGGYYENSGLHTLDRVKAELERSASDLNIDVRVISFTASPNLENPRSYDSENTSLLAPVDALFAARMQRGVDEWEAFLRRHGQFDAHLSLFQGSFYHHLPLGWTLSRQSLTFIKLHFGVPSDCGYAERFWEKTGSDFDGARIFLAERFPTTSYGAGLPGFRPRDLDVRDSNRLVKLDMLSQRIYMGCQAGQIFRDLAN